MTQDSKPVPANHIRLTLEWPCGCKAEAEIDRDRILAAASDNLELEIFGAPALTMFVEIDTIHLMQELHNDVLTHNDIKRN